MPSINTIKRQQQQGEERSRIIKKFLSENGIPFSCREKYRIRVAARNKPTIDIYPKGMKLFNHDKQEWKTWSSTDELDETIVENYLV